MYGFSPAKSITKELTILKNTKEFYEEYFRSKNSTKCYCPECNEDLVQQKDNIEINDVEKHLVVFKCKNCETESTWDFSAPAPLLLDSN